MIFAAMMGKTPEERLLIGFDMTPPTRQLVWSEIVSGGTEDERRRLFIHGFMASIGHGNRDWLFASPHSPRRSHSVSSPR